MQNLERDLRLLKQKIDLLIDGYQVLYMKLEQHSRTLRRVEATLNHEELLTEEGEDTKVVRMSDRFLTRVRRNFQDGDLDPDDKTLA